MVIENLDQLSSYVKTLVAELTQNLQSRAVLVTLSGELGAGKTTLTQQIGKELGLAHMQSPSYVYVREYRIPTGLFIHADLWRVEQSADFDALKLNEYLQAGNLVVIEWPKQFVSDEWVERFTDDALVVRLNIEVEKDQRIIRRM